MDSKKLCTDCKEVKDLNKFYPLSGSKDGKRLMCNICYRKRYEVSMKRRSLRLKELPNTLNTCEKKEIRSYFHNACALTGNASDVRLDHFVPVAWGTTPLKYGLGGTRVSNMVPLDNFLNNSTSSKNPFDWFDSNKVKHNLSESKWEEILEYLARKNGMSEVQFRNTVNACFKEVKIKRWVERLESKSGWKSDLLDRPLPQITHLLFHGVNIDVAVQVYGSSELNDFIKSEYMQNIIKNAKDRYKERVDRKFSCEMKV